MQLPHEVFSPGDRAHVDGFFRDRLGPLADEFDTETRHALLYAAWGVPVLLLTAPSQGLAHWYSQFLGQVKTDIPPPRRPGPWIRIS